MDKVHDFSFRVHAPQFDDHIKRSIPAYMELGGIAVDVAPRFVAPGSSVIDLGCSSGLLLRSIRDSLIDRRPDIRFHGVDIETSFSAQWSAIAAPNLSYVCADARHTAIENASLVISFFTVQFLRPNDKAALLAKIYAGLNKGGCLLIAEKVLAETGRMQDALSFPYYDFKQANGFTADEILAKERSLRGQMTLWTEAEIEDGLRECGFRDTQRVWGRFPFFAWLAVK